ncbi:hypothetical protein HRI_000130300 [Hibiscus trionum]|uniref:Uncharacterized protein n=1 Tax=Hibiscus trionum TaxID=183268 RepID=A0A9W7LIF7_HIBTR|nr:hypothetical protein HRI_000130300 [Hibiscus trionum]
MGSHGHNKQNKISMDVAAEHSSSSLDSLSFASLVCIDRNQHSKSVTGTSSSAPDQSNKDHGHEFEFRIPHNPNRNYYPDKVISGGRLRPLEFLMKSAQPHATTDNNKSRPTMVSHKSNEDAKNRGRREANGSKSWFGRRLFQSLVSPCRECRAVKPSMKAPQKRIKLHQ